MDKKILFAGLIAVFVIGFLFFGQVLLPQGDNSKSEFDLKSFSSVVSSDRPKVFLQAFAQTIDSHSSNPVKLVVYQQGMALVSETRELSFEKGLNLLKFSDVPTQIDSTSVLFEDSASPDTKIVEQNYDYDTVSENSMLEKFLGKDLTVQVIEGTEAKSYSGKLLSYNGSIVLETESGIVSIKNVEKIVFPKDSDLISKPTLVLKVFTQDAGKRNVKVSYISNGFDWSAVYVAKFDEAKSTIDLIGNVNITNNSGASFSNALLTLLAGQVNRAYAGGSNYYAKSMVAESAAPSSDFAQATSFEYHTYTLDRPTDLIDKQSKQILLLSAKNVPVLKEFVFNGYGGYYGGESKPEAVDIKISFKNDEKSNLGIPLPAGTVRVFKDSANGMQFLGEDSIDHTPKETERKLLIGKAFDVTAEKKTISTDRSGNCSIDSYEVSVSNQKTEDIFVKVLQNAYGNSTILNSSIEPEKLDAYTFQFNVPVKAESKNTLTYTVRSCN